MREQAATCATLPKIGRSGSSHPDKGAMTAANFLYSLRDEILRRLLRNAGLLLFGQTTASVLNLIAVAVTARALGPEGFGLLATIQAYAMVWDRLANFQSFEVLIKFGAELLHQVRIDSFKSLVKFTLILDGSSAVAGALLAALIREGP